MDNNIEVLVPIWVLKEKVEKDHEEWMFFNKPTLAGVGIEIDKDDARYQEWPMDKSTTHVLDVLANHGIYFDPNLAEWTE